MSQVLEVQKTINKIKQEPVETDELTFEELCPKYSALFTMWGNLNREARFKIITKIISSPAKCVVGEAHGGSHDYQEYCSHCITYAGIDGFPSVFHDKGDRDIDYDRLEIVKDQFVGHMNRCHR